MPHKSKKYLLNRFLRLAPTYYIALFAAIPLIFYNQKMEGVLPVWENFIYVVTHLSFTQSLLPFKKLISYWNIHSWSLGVEMFLYSLSPFLIQKIQKLHSKKLIPLFLGLMLINSFYFIFLIYGKKQSDPFSLYFAPLYVPTFLSGVVAGKYYLSQKSFFDKWSIFLFPIASLLLIGSFTLGFSDIFYSSFNPFYQICFTLLILSVCRKNIFNKWLGTSVMIVLGNASYAMYILQAPVKVLTQQTLSKVFDIKLSVGIFYFLMVFMTITICSILLSKFLDPWLKKKLKIDTR